MFARVYGLSKADFWSLTFDEYAAFVKDLEAVSGAQQNDDNRPDNR